MKLTLSGRPYGLKIDKDGEKILTIKPDKEGIDIMALLPFHKHECDLRILGTKYDFRTHGYLDELSLKNELKLKFVCKEKVDLNTLNAIIEDPETTSIVLDDKQSVLDDFSVRVEHKGNSEVLGIAAEMVNTYGLEGAKEHLENAKRIKAAAR